MWAYLEEILQKIAVALIIMGAVESQTCQTSIGVAVVTARHYVFSNAILLSEVKGKVL